MDWLNELLAQIINTLGSAPKPERDPFWLSNESLFNHYEAARREMNRAAFRVKLNEFLDQP